MYDVDKDSEVQKDIVELEILAESLRKGANSCKMTDLFLDNIGIIGGLHRKYTKFTFLPDKSQSTKRFDDAIRKAKEANIKFVRNCDCRMK